MWCMRIDFVKRWFAWWKKSVDVWYIDPATFSPHFFSTPWHQPKLPFPRCQLSESPRYSWRGKQILIPWKFRPFLQANSPWSQDKRGKRNKSSLIGWCIVWVNVVSLFLIMVVSHLPRQQQPKKMYVPHVMDASMTGTIWEITKLSMKWNNETHFPKSPPSINLLHEPVSSSAEWCTLGTNVKRENLGRINPANRTPGSGKSSNEKVDHDDGKVRSMDVVTHIDVVLLFSLVPVYFTTGTHNDTTKQHGSSHEESTTHQSLTTTKLVKEQNGRDGGKHIEHTIDTRSNQSGRVIRNTGLLEDQRCIIPRKQMWVFVASIYIAPPTTYIMLLIPVNCCITFDTKC